MKFLPLIWNGLFRKKTRTILTVGSILFPVFLVAFMATFLRTLNLPDQARERGLYRLVTRHKVGLTTPLPYGVVNRIAPLEGVRAITPIDRIAGLYRDASAGNVFPRFAVDPDKFLEVFDDAKIVQGSAEDWKRDRTGGLVGVALVRKYGWKVGDRVTIKGTLYPVDLTFTVQVGEAAEWRRVVDTGRPSPEDIAPEDEARVLHSRAHVVGARSVVVLLRDRGTRPDPALRRQS